MNEIEKLELDLFKTKVELSINRISNELNVLKKNFEELIKFQDKLRQDGKLILPKAQRDMIESLKKEDEQYYFNLGRSVGITDVAKINAHLECLEEFGLIDIIHKSSNDGYNYKCKHVRLKNGGLTSHHFE